MYALHLITYGRVVVIEVTLQAINSKFDIQQTFCIHLYVKLLNISIAFHQIFLSIR